MSAWSDGAGGLVLVGAGRMGGAMLKGWMTGGAEPGFAPVTVIEPSAEARDAARALGAQTFKVMPADLAAKAGVIVLAVKPQLMAQTVAGWGGDVGPGAVVISVAAGIDLAALQGWFPRASVVRAMPNAPAAVGKGVTAMMCGPGVSPAQADLADAVLQAAGRVVRLDDEALMDAVTAVSGSGPAYVYLLAEALAEAGAAAGLPGDLAAELARETIIGAGAVLDQVAEPPAALRDAVTSPGGTTAAALFVLDGEKGVRDLLTQAVQAAADRSRALRG